MKGMESRLKYSVLITDDERLARETVLRKIHSLSIFVPEGEGDIAERLFCSDRTLVDMLSDRSGFCLDRRIGELMVFSTDISDSLALQELEMILPPFETTRRFLYVGIPDQDDEESYGYGIGMV
jgi:hypothetical protein